MPLTVPGAASTLKPPPFMDEPKMGLVSTSTVVMFDAAAHFGCNRTHHGNSSQSELSYATCRNKIAAIHATAACSGLSTADSSIACDPRAPSVSLPDATFVPFHLDGALFTREAFWALPATLAADSTESLMWSLVVQRLVWLSGNQVVVRRCRSSLNASARSKLVSSMTRLNEWNCEASTIQQCIVDLVLDNSAMLKDPVTSDYSHWIYALTKIGYTFPTLQMPVKKECNTALFHAVDYAMPLLSRHLSSENFPPINNLASIDDVYKDTCSGLNKNITSYMHVHFSQPWIQFDDILLMVVFNNPHYEVIPYIETLYRPFFPNILYCGPSDIDTKRYPGLSKFAFSFISYGLKRDHTPGAFNYRCTAMALQMGYEVEGVLAAADDLLILVPTLSHLIRNAVLFQPLNVTHICDISRLLECKHDKCNVPATWFWWKPYKAQTTAALKEIENGKNSSAIIRTCYERLLSGNGAANRANAAFSDMFYIPSKLSQAYVELADVFLRHDVFLEIAVATIIRCMPESAGIQPLLGEVLWKEQRNDPGRHFNSDIIRGKNFFHPMKWGSLANRAAHNRPTRLFCTKVLPYLHDPLGRLTDY